MLQPDAPWMPTPKTILPKILLIIDDDADDIELFCLAVGEIDKTIKCISARTGDEALLLLRKNLLRKPDYIFLDLNMPRMNGKQCLGMIKKHPEFSDIPVIIYSTSKLPQDYDETKALGAVHFLTKPSKHDDLKKAISYVLEEKWELMKELDS